MSKELYNKEQINSLNKDIENHYPHLAQIEEGFNTSHGGVGRLVMLDRYSQKDTGLQTLKVGDLVITIVKDDPTYPTRGIGNIVKLDGKFAEIKLEEDFIGTLEGEELETRTIRRNLNAVDKPLELFYEQIALRVGRNLAGYTTKLNGVNKEDIARLYAQELSDLKLVPAGRVLFGAGSGTEVTYFNCFAGDTIVQTEDGSIPIKDLSGDISVLSMGGVYRTAEFKSFGEQELFEVELANGEKIEATAGHEWFYITPKSGWKKTTTLELEGKRIPYVVKSKTFDKEELEKGIQNGMIYGDGTVQHGEANIKLFGEKKELETYFSEEHIAEHYDGDYVGVYKLDSKLKELPDTDASESYWQGFVMGLIATDGFVDNRGSYGFHSASKEDLNYIIKHLFKTNFSYTSLKMTREFSPFDDSYAPVYKVQLSKFGTDESVFLRTTHHDNFANSAAPTKTQAVEVIKVTPLNKIEEVFCAIEPETNSFVIGTGYLTGNCYVMPYIDDSRGGISKHREEAMEIMSRGGGVGTNGSTLRPKNTIAKGVNGKSSGAVSWLNDLAELTHLVEQGGSRRGAQMIMMADWHPDIIEFIVSKMQNPGVLRWLINNSNDKKIIAEAKNKLTFTPIAHDETQVLDAIMASPNVSIEKKQETSKIMKDGGTYSVENLDFLTGANISVAVTDDFMEAVENDEDYDLRFPDLDSYTDEEKAFYDENWMDIGDVREWEEMGYAIKTYSTHKAKDIWELISFCATYAAEPGIFFLDSANEMTNAQSYGQKVVATNPCGEQPLAPYSVCNLAAVNLGEFVNKRTGEIQYDKLEASVRTLVRMQDAVIDATPYFLEDNKKQALGERRIGLGVMGLHDMLIWAGVRYGSKESIDLIDKVFDRIANSAYQESAQIAEEFGESFPFLEENIDAFLDGAFIKRLSDETRKQIKEKGIRNSHLLTIAPTGSTGTMVGVSTGLEPYFSFKYFRSGRLGRFIEVNEKIVENWLTINPEFRDKELPDFFVSAMELSPEEHVDVQTTIQYWIDSSISKTVNAPKGYTVAQVQKIYERLYRQGAKGGTVYVDGSRDSQVLDISNDEKTSWGDLTEEEEELLGEVDKKPMRADKLGRKIGNEIGDLCPICNEGTVEDIGGCATCTNCSAQLSCGL